MARPPALALGLLTSLATLASLAPGPARAESPYALDARIDLPVSGLALVLAMPGLLEQPTPACLPSSCDPSDVNAIDRAVIGNWSPDARAAADWTLAAFIALPLVLDAIDTGGDGWLADSAVYAESLLVTTALTQLTKSAVDRPAPFVYDERLSLDYRATNHDGPRSFPSGHTSTAFAIAATATVTYWHRHPDDASRWVVLAVSGAIATTIALLKVEAGYHFWSDVVGGAVLGTSVGVLIPVLHFR